MHGCLMRGKLRKGPSLSDSSHLIQPPHYLEAPYETMGCRFSFNERLYFSESQLLDVQFAETVTVFKSL